MLDFKRLEYSDYERIKKYFDADNLRSIKECNNIICDRVFDCTFFWRNYYDTHYAEVGDSVILSISVGGTVMFSFPMGGDVMSALSSVREYACETGNNTYFCFIPENDLHYFRDAFDCVFISEEPDWSDYLYDMTDLMNYSGKRYHGQRNFYNRFSKMNPDRRFVSIDSSNSGDVIPFVKAWFSEHDDTSEMSVAEEKGIYELLGNWDRYSMNGGFLLSGDKIVGFTAGEIVGDTAFIQIEKAFHSFPGVYQYMSAEYLKSICRDGVKYVNREEDMGIPGLRKAKEDLHPIKKLKKYTLYCC